MTLEYKKYSHDSDLIYSKLKQDLRSANIQYEDSITSALSVEEQGMSPYSSVSSPGSRDIHQFPISSQRDFEQATKNSLPQPVHTALYQDALIRAERKILIERTVIYIQGCFRCKAQQ